MTFTDLMVIAVQLDFRDAAIEQYDALIEGMGWLPGGPMPIGGYFHWATETDDGFRIIEVWESQEAFETFATRTIAPLYRGVGLLPPEICYFTVHNFFVGSR